MKILQENLHKILLMGRLRSGKDYVAAKLPFMKVSMAAPLYCIANDFFGYDVNRSTPGFRDFLRKVGQFGRGWISEEYPLTIERAIFIEMIRREGKHLSGYEEIDWEYFGEVKTFWVEVLLESHCDIAWKNVIVTDLRFEDDLLYLMREKWEIYLVVCTEETRAERIKALNEVGDAYPLAKDMDRLREVDLLDISERLAAKLTNTVLYPEQFKSENQTISPPQIIWNDHREPPPHLKDYLTVSDFLSKYATVQQSNSE